MMSIGTNEGQLLKGLPSILRQTLTGPEPSTVTARGAKSMVTSKISKLTSVTVEMVTEKGKSHSQCPQSQLVSLSQ